MAKLKTQLILAFLLVALIPVMIIGYISTSTSEQELKNEIKLHLETAAQEKGNNILKFLEEQQDKILIAATHQDLSNEELQEIVDSNQEFYELFVLDSNGIVISSSDISRIGLDRSIDTYFTNVKDKTYIKDAYFSATTKQNSLAFSTPFHAGVLVARTNLDHLNQVTVERAGLKTTGEAYIVNKDNYMITPSRFTSDTFLKQKVDTIGTDHCFQEHGVEEHVIARTYNDYRGVSVLGSHFYIEQIGWCLLTEIDEEEAFVAIRKTKSQIIIISTILAILIIIITFFYSNRITKPINRLTQDVNEVSKGKFDIQLQKSNIWEIQTLTDSLNRVLSSMKLAILRTGIKKEEIGIKKDKLAGTPVYMGDLIQSELFENSKDCIKVLDLNGKILYMNKGGLEEHGFKTKSQAIGWNWLASLSPESRKEIKNILPKAIKGKSFKIDVRHIKESNRSWCRIGISPIRNSKEKIIGVLAVSKDISKLKEKTAKPNKKAFDKVVTRTVDSVKAQSIENSKGNSKNVKDLKKNKKI